MFCRCVHTRYHQLRGILIPGLDSRCSCSACSRLLELPSESHSKLFLNSLSSLCRAECFGSYARWATVLEPGMFNLIPPCDLSMFSRSMMTGKVIGYLNRETSVRLKPEIWKR
jgi:hypothetical protein